MFLIGLWQTGMCCMSKQCQQWIRNILCKNAIHYQTTTMDSYYKYYMCVYLWYIYINSTVSFSSQGDPGPEGPRGLPGMVGPQVGLIFASTNVLHLRRILSDYILNSSFLLFRSLCDRAQQDEPACLDWKVIRWSKYLYYCSASVCNVWLGRTIWDPCDILLTHPANSVLCISV